MIRLLGDRVVLRAFREEEFDEVAAREAGPDAGEETRQRLRDRLWRSGQWTDHELRLAVEADGTLVGDCQARISDWALPRGVTELGIGLFEQATGKGYGPDVLRTLSGFLLREEAYHRVQLSTDAANHPMRRAAEKAGFVFEGVLRGFMREPFHDEPTDYAMYARTSADQEGHV